MGTERPAEVIARLRLQRGLTQAQASRRAEMAQSTWSTVESGMTGRPRPDTRRRIARALCVTPGAIWPNRPRPLHLDDVEDPRWPAAVRRLARRVDREGSPLERAALGRQLITVLDYADPGSGDPPGEHDPWQELWQLGSSLLFPARRDPLAIIGAKLVERELQTFLPDAAVGPISAKRGHRSPSSPAARHRRAAS